MNLSIQYQETGSAKISGAFLPGNSPESWLREACSWQIDLRGLDCYVLPENIRTINPAGLFVVFNEGKIPEQKLIRFPYQLLSRKLFIPVHAVLFPQVSKEELQNLLLWETYVFHPSIGLVGFAQEEKTDLAAFIEFDLPVQKNWKLAKKGLPVLPSLHRISLEPQNAEDLLKSLLEEIEKKPIQDIKKDEKSNAFTRFIDQIGIGSLKAGISIVNVFKSNSGSSGNGSKGEISGESDSGKNGLFRRFENWMHEKLDDLEKKREDEIERLIRLFEENPEEALKFALPLNSPYFNRGKALPASQLTRQNINFDLRRIGGSGPSDYWDIGNYYSDLRSRYQNSAQQEINSGNHRRAAYIYAHLLGDFHSAANALVQGKYYREAAAIYKDHLHNKSMAAECLEKGGLLLEAIDIYVALENNEKAGDLYRKLGQDEPANANFEICKNRFLKTEDYLGASRIEEYKLKKPESARSILIEGWLHSRQAEECLIKYFEKSNTEEKQLEREIKSVYTSKMPQGKAPDFLNVLAHIERNNPKPEISRLSRNLAYEIISGQISIGNAKEAHKLNHFIPDDTLIRTDCNRFVLGDKNKLPNFNKSFKEIQLDKNVKWFTGTNFRNQFLVLGIQAHALVLVRGNWNGDLEYHRWACTFSGKEIISLSTDPRYTNLVILHCNQELYLEKKVFPQNEKFDSEIIVESPSWFPSGLIGYCINEKNQIVTISTAADATVIARYSTEGILMDNFDFRTEEKESKVVPTRDIVSELIYRKNHFYFYNGRCLFQVTYNGVFVPLQLSADIRMIAATAGYSELRLAVFTDIGFMIVRPSLDGMKTDESNFAQDFVPSRMKFLPNNQLLIAGNKTARIYNIDGTPVISSVIETNSKIIAVLPSMSLNQFAIAEENGKVTMYETGKK